MVHVQWFKKKSPFISILFQAQVGCGRMHFLLALQQLPRSAKLRRSLKVHDHFGRFEINGLATDGTSRIGHNPTKAARQVQRRTAAYEHHLRRAFQAHAAVHIGRRMREIDPARFSRRGLGGRANLKQAALSRTQNNRNRALTLSSRGPSFE